MITQLKTIVSLIVLVILAYQLQSQNIYLKISEANKTSISYPPGTKFELKNNQNYTVLKEGETPLVFKIDEPYTLYVFPDYKSGKDVYNLSKGKIELVSNEVYMNAIKTHKQESYQSNGVTLDNTYYSASTIKKGETNVILEFSNWVVFSYLDGNVTAIINNDAVDVKGNYLIYTKEGVVKISYNPKNKQVWWTFELYN